ncbi:hypothetical protein CAPTEDRAFT_220454 [Capitella teleta]|uniref:WAP domain-containing protein n=1 Tax=Capitella teleta TaxID=283909 RepID=R7VDK9_CAPTE|nr:hypothetical protein CAPTEDRAFT_220454 [Capitella teleta]|eukprot:ELU13755.1 hypothetical protein CAPTEDRAFT_220454 [Capitella teleta]
MYKFSKSISDSFKSISVEPRSLCIRAERNSKMRWKGLVVCLLLVAAVDARKKGKGKKTKPGTCPTKQIECFDPNPKDECRKDKHCDAKQKCCPSVCNKKACMDPIPSCPVPLCKNPCEYGVYPDENGCFMCDCRPNPCSLVKCASGTVCKVQEVMECDTAHCNPVAACVSDEKPGECPVSTGPCIDPATADQCESDTDCKKQDKCCKTECAKACVRPLIIACAMVKCTEPCEHGFVTDSNGCQTCECIPPPDPCSASNQEGFNDALHHTCNKQLHKLQFVGRMSEGKFFALPSQLNGLVLDMQNDAVECRHVAFPRGPNQLFCEDNVNGCLRSALDDNFVLEVQDALADTKQGQRTINRMNPTQCLDIKGAKDKNGSKVIEYEYHEAYNQHWNFQDI